MSVIENDRATLGQYHIQFLAHKIPAFAKLKKQLEKITRDIDKAKTAWAESKRQVRTAILLRGATEENVMAVEVIVAGTA